MEEGLGVVNFGGGFVGVVVFLGIFYSLWDREVCVWEAGLEDYVDLMFESLFGKEEKWSIGVFEIKKKS